MKKPKLSTPVTAISEADARGEVAEIFADIRETMALPMLTSIWRILVDIEGGLPRAWEATKSIYQSGQPQASLLKLREQITWPIPGTFRASQLSCVGVDKDDLPAITAILDAYNRSNGLNLIALTALISEPEGSPANAPIPPAPEPWPQLSPLLSQDDIPAETWQLLREIAFATRRENGGTQEPTIATIWRHLAHWPGLLALIFTGLSSLIQSGQLQEAMVQVSEMAKAEGAHIAHLRPDVDAIPADARAYITHYIAGVHRVVTMGHIVRVWLQTLRIS